MRNPTDQRATGRLLGVVQLRVGDRTYTVPVQALSFVSDGDRPETAGGFFVEGEQLGILVDASAPDVDARIRAASEEAVRHLSLKVLN